MRISLCNLPPTIVHELIIDVHVNTFIIISHDMCSFIFGRETQQDFNVFRFNPYCDVCSYMMCKHVIVKKNIFQLNTFGKKGVPEGI